MVSAGGVVGKARQWRHVFFLMPWRVDGGVGQLTTFGYPCEKQRGDRRGSTMDRKESWRRRRASPFQNCTMGFASGPGHLC
jgi:hypothetical protein